jgi:tRNA modification GTPase
MASPFDDNTVPDHAAPDDTVTRACLLTPPGRSALAVLGVRGPAAERAVAASFRPHGRQPLEARGDAAVVFGRWGGPPGEELVVVRRRSDDLEVHCHGGTAASDAILRDLARAGCQRVTPSGWLGLDAPDQHRGPAFEREVLEAEARLALTQARGPAACRILCQQLSGSLATAWESAEAETEASRRQAITSRVLRWSGLGLRLTRPWRVVVAGPPNAGKSSLVNAIAGFSRSIVSPVAGTTRDVLETRLVLAGWDCILVDTAGLRPDPADAVERAGLARAIEAARGADLLLELNATDAVDLTPPLPASLDDVPRIPVLTKADLQGIAAAREADGRYATSVVSGEGIGELVDAIIRRLVPAQPALGEAVPFTPRQVAAFESLRDEPARGS